MNCFHFLYFVEMRPVFFRILGLLSCKQIVVNSLPIPLNRQQNFLLLQGKFSCRNEPFVSPRLRLFASSIPMKYPTFVLGNQSIQTRFFFFVDGNSVQNAVMHQVMGSMATDNSFYILFVSVIYKMHLVFVACIFCRCCQSVGKRFLFSESDALLIKKVSQEFRKKLLGQHKVGKLCKNNEQ